MPPFHPKSCQMPIIIDNVIEDIEGTPVKAPLDPLLKQLQVAAQGGWVQVIHY